MIARAVLPDEVYRGEGCEGVVTDGRGVDDDVEAEDGGERAWKKG